MSSTNQTLNFALPQWVGTDPFCMADFNGAFSAIDAALAGGLKLITGTYTGTGVNPKRVDVGAAPKFLVLITHAENSDSSQFISAFGVSGHMARIRFSSSISPTGAVTFNDTGFQVAEGSGLHYMNHENKTYYYAAFC